MDQLLTSITGNASFNTTVILVIGLIGLLGPLLILMFVRKLNKVMKPVLTFIMVVCGIAGTYCLMQTTVAGVDTSGSGFFSPESWDQIPALTFNLNRDILIGPVALKRAFIGLPLSIVTLTFDDRVKEVMIALLVFAMSFCVMVIACNLLDLFPVVSEVINHAAETLSGAIKRTPEAISRIVKNATD